MKFRQKVVPGDTLILRLELLAPIRRGISTMKGYVFVGDKLVSEAEFMAQIVKNNNKIKYDNEYISSSSRSSRGPDRPERNYRSVCRD